MKPQGFLLAGALLMAASSLDMTQNHPAPSNCPKVCTCRSRSFANFNGKLRMVNCSYGSLREFPLDIPLDTEALLLHHNKFYNLSFVPHLPDLKILDLSYNKIRTLDNRRIYDNVPSLQYLYLKENRVTHLLDGTFTGLRHLKVLDLSFNNLQRMGIHAFGGLDHLERIYLDHNRLAELDKLWLQSMTALNEIHLSENMISVLEFKVFDSLLELVHLDLAGNHISRIDGSAFSNVNEIKVLDLSRNRLTRVPRELLKISELQILLLDANQIQRLETHDFYNSSVTEISLSFLPQLRVIEKGAFTNLPRLVNLQIHDNPNLIFIHPHAFQNVTNLIALYLHNNKLMSVPMSIKDSLPSLEELHLYHNPLHCDCNVYWIKKELQDYEDARNSSLNFDMYIKEADKLLCNGPTNITDIPLRDLNISSLSPVCPPTAIPLFSQTYNVTVGENLYLECQAIGVPEPKMYWLLPGFRVLNSSMKNDRVTLIDDTAITIKGVTSADAGSYACKAQNIIYFDISSTVVSVQKKDLKLYPISISSDYITVEWRGSIPQHELADFQLHYRESNSEAYKILYLRPTMARYTIGGLEPLTTYEICIMHLHKYTIHCSNITTEHALSLKSGITRIKSSKIVAGVCTALGVTAIVCCILTVMKKLKKRKEYKDPEPDKGDPLSQIPLENLYQPPSTPLCTSRTALLPHSQI